MGSLGSTVGSLLTICVGKRNKQFNNICLHIGDFKSFSEAGRIQRIRRLGLSQLLHSLLESLLPCLKLIAHIFSYFNDEGKVASNLETNSAFVPPSPNLLLHTLSCISCPHLDQVGPALLPILKAP